MSQIKMSIVRINGRPVDLSATIQTKPRGSDREKVDNIYEAKLISRIDKRIERQQVFANLNY